jgi:energy-coupling factor transporter ATP-binding protein EcfA2
MRLREVILLDYASVEYMAFEAKPFTILYGKNNSGKTNILEAIYGVLSPAELDDEDASRPLPPAMRGTGHPPYGALIVELEAGAPFDDNVLALRPSVSEGPADGVPLPTSQAALIVDHVKGWWTFNDPRDYFRQVDRYWDDPSLSEHVDALRAALPPTSVNADPPLPIFLNWEIDNIETRVEETLLEYLRCRSKLRDVPVLLQVMTPLRVDAPEPGKPLRLHGGGPATPESWRINESLQEFFDQFAVLATRFLPDFLDGSIQASIQVPMMWNDRLRMTLRYRGRESEKSDVIGSLGRGSARWVAAAIQIALHLIVRGRHSESAEVLREENFSGHLLLLDEPEAHLHPLAVKSIIRWCHRMVDSGFNIVVASHHEELLRHSGADVAHVHISRGGNPPETQARTLLASTTPLLQDLARDLGMHPATVLSLIRGILFVEGPLDKAVLDEYASPALEAAGIAVVPIHGTRNLEGLIDGELTPRLGIKVGILTDDTDPATMAHRSNKKRSREETWVTRLQKSYADQGFLPPTSFGIPEKDLLFALPAEGIRNCYPERASSFPGWLQMLEECRAAFGLGPSDSPPWKDYAEQQYGLPLSTAEGVRSLVHTLDLAGVEFPTIRRVIDQIVAWAAAD